MQSRFIFLFFFLGIFTLSLHPFDGNADFYHHVNTGKYILDHKSLPYFDPFSHTAKDMPWIAHSWGSGVIFYLIFEALGGIGISLLIASLALLTFFLLYKLLKSYGFSDNISYLSLSLAAPLILQRFPQRPESFSYPLAVGFLLIDKLKINHPRVSLLFPLLILVWVNIYGSGSFLGILLIGFFIFKQFVIDKFKILPESKIFYLCSLICLPLSLFNGYGLKSLLYFYYYIPKVAQYEGEWAGIIAILNYFPLNSLIAYQYQILSYFFYLSLFLILIVPGFKKLFKDKFTLFLSLAVFAPVFTLRQISMATILSLPALTMALDLQKGFKKKVFICLVAVAALFLILIALWQSPPGFKKEENASQKQFVEFIKNNNLSGKAFNHTHMGSFITYNFYPDILVFYDTRDEVYLETDALQDLYGVFSSGSSIIPLLEKYKIDLVLGDIITDGINYKDLFYSEGWTIVFLDDRYFIALPKKIAKEKNIPALDFLDPYSQTGVKSGFEQKGVEYYSSLNSKSFNNQALLAGSLISLDRLTEAQDILKNQPESSGPYKGLFEKDRHYLLAVTYLKQNNCKEAKIYLEKVEEDIKNTFVFDPKKTLPSAINKGYAFYFLNCENDFDKAKEYLNLYLSQKDITPLEKIRTEREFINRKIN